MSYDANVAETGLIRTLQNLDLIESSPINLSANP